MYESHYKIAGISVVVTAKFRLADDEAYRLYRTDGVTSGQVYRIRLEETGALPAHGGTCLFHNELNEVYNSLQGPGLIHYYRRPFWESPCAWDYLEDADEKTIYYLAEAERYFMTALGVFNAAGFERILQRFGKALYHCSYVDHEGKALLFSAPSGGGKTTHALLWEKYTGAKMINGDRSVLEMSEGGVICHGLPIAGSSGVFVNRSLPLAAIFTLKKATNNQVRRLKGKEAFLAVYSQLTVNMWNPSFVQDAIDTSLYVADRIPIFELSCTISQEAVETALGALRE